jgi:hypothetical protein
MRMININDWRRARRGFLLLVVIGILSVLLALCIGFLSLTRAEVEAVSTIRDRTDSRNMVWTALDWMINNIVRDVMQPDPTDATKKIFKTDRGCVVSRADSPADPCFRWWYRPYEPRFTIWWTGFSSYAVMNNLTTRVEAPWVYLPASYFPVSAVRGRFYVQVLDPNSTLNINDWLEDCSPTQCQVTHMLMDYIGGQGTREKSVEQSRYSLITTPAPSAAEVSNYPRTTMRYNECWLAASRSVRYAGHIGSPASMAPNWVTSNESWMGVYGAEYNALTTVNAAAGTPMAIQLLLGGATRQAYVDPDTGRSPINVNTCLASGEDVYSSTAGASRAWTMEAVFNIESLRRIIKIGKFFDTGNVERDLSDPTVFASLTDDDKKKLERLKTKLAYQHQETLVRYFTGAYDHAAAVTHHAGGMGGWDRGYGNGSATERKFYNPYGTGVNMRKNYRDTYSALLGSAEVNKVLSCAATWDTSKTRFPYGLVEFRERVKYDLAKMTENNRNISTNNKTPGTIPLYGGTSMDGAEYVGADRDNNFEILPGKLDKRMASAVFDNIVPGKAFLFPGDANIEVKDPLGQLYKTRWSRKEDVEPLVWQDYGAWRHNNVWLPRTGGRDIASSTAPEGPYERVATIPPYRQNVFGPDWFSTELTTTTTTFVFVIRAQLIEAASGAANPQILEEHVVSMTVEIAPDVMVEDAANGATYGAAAPDPYYYRAGRPNYYKTAVAPSPDSMDTDCATRPCNGPGGTPTGQSAIAEWIDYRNVRPVDAPAFYAPNGRQLHKRIIIRNMLDQNQSALK